MTGYLARAHEAEQMFTRLGNTPMIGDEGPLVINLMLGALHIWKEHARVLREAAALQQQVADLKADLAIARGEAPTIRLSE